jgi:hypothetical protein
MSNWDLGFGREPAESYEPFYPPHPGAPGEAAFRAGDAESPGSAGWPGTEDYPGDDDELYDPPYPITYERDAFDGGSSWPAAPRPASSQPPQPPAPAPAPPPPAAPWDEPWLDDLRGGRVDGPWRSPNSRPVWRRWLIPTGIAALAAGISATLVLLAGAHPSAPAAAGTARPTTPATSAAGRPPASRPAAPRKTVTGAAPPLTLATAEGVLANYTTVNNSANAERSDSELAMVETGGSYAIDAGLYTIQQATGETPFPAFSPDAATYYIPQAEPAGGPRWFVARVSNAFSAHPKKVTSTEYLLFTQSAPGDTWLNAIEPYLLPGAEAPQIAIGGNGLAQALSPTATSLAAAPGQLAGLTAAALDGTGSAVSVPGPGEQPDRRDQKFWQAKLPNATITDTHAPATGTGAGAGAGAGAGTVGQTFALLTTNGGALVFYTDAAELTITPPAGSSLHLTVPGFYSSADPLTHAGLSYLDQFAAYDPPPAAGSPTVIAEYSGLTGKN